MVLTGASGHIGYHVGRVLLSRGYPLLLLARRTNENVRDLVDRGARCEFCDLSDRATFAHHLVGAPAVFHLAAANTTRTDDADAVLEGTLKLTREVVEGCEAAGVARLIYTSSVVVLGRSRDPRRLVGLDDRETSLISPYIRGKVLAERYLDARIGTTGLDIRRLYPSWVVGRNCPRPTPPQRLIRDYVSSPQPFFFRGGISITEAGAVARAHVAAFERGSRNGRYLLGGRNVTFREFYSSLARMAGCSPPRVSAPKPALVAAAHALRWISRSTGLGDPIDPAYVRTVVGAFSWYDSSRAEKELGYEIPDLEWSLREAVAEARMRQAGIHAVNSLRVKPGAERPARWLITGVPGWLGNTLTSMLVERMEGGAIPSEGIRLYCEKRFEGLIDPGRGIEAVFGDICDGKRLRTALQGIDKVCHLAGVISPPRTTTLYRVNTEGTRCLVDACIDAGVRRVVFLGTDSICGHGTAQKRIFDEHTPPNPYRDYGKSKYLAEKYVLERTREGLIDGTSLRAFWFFGPQPSPHQRKFFEMLRWKRQIVFGNGRNLRSITTTENLSHAIILALQTPRTIGRAYWIGDDGPYSVDDIYNKLTSAIGVRYRPLYFPGVVCYGVNFLDLVMGRLGRISPRLHSAGKFFFDIAGTIDAASRDFGYRPIVTLDQSIKNTDMDDA